MSQNTPSWFSSKQFKIFLRLDIFLLKCGVSGSHLPPCPLLSAYVCGGGQVCLCVQVHVVHVYECLWNL